MQTSCSCHNKHLWGPHSVPSVFVSLWMPLSSVYFPLVCLENSSSFSEILLSNNFFPSDYFLLHAMSNIQYFSPVLFLLVWCGPFIHLPSPRVKGQVLKCSDMSHAWYLGWGWLNVAELNRTWNRKTLTRQDCLTALTANQGGIPCPQISPQVICQNWPVPDLVKSISSRILGFKAWLCHFPPVWL